MRAIGYAPFSAPRTRWSSAQWIWTALLAFFIALAVYDNLDWWPVLIPSAILTWYGAMRSTTGRRRGQE